MCEGISYERKKWKYDIYYLSEHGDLKKILKTVRINQHKVEIMLCVGGHGGAPESAPILDIMNFLYQMNNKKNRHLHVFGIYN